MSFLEQVVARAGVTGKDPSGCGNLVRLSPDAQWMLPEGQPRSGLRAVGIDANVQLGDKPRSGRPTGLCDIAQCPIPGLISGRRQV